MRKGFAVSGIIGLLISIIYMVLSSSFPIQAQEVDSFYIGLLQKGEQSFIAGNFSDAIRQLNTSVFGLHHDKNLHAKALVYLSLCHYYIQETERSKSYLTEAIELVGLEGFSGVSLDERAENEVSGLMARFKLGQFLPGQQGTRVIDRPELGASEDPPKDAGPNNSIASLKARISSDPSNIDNFYALYRLYAGDNKRREARKVLEDLVEHHPDEVNGFYLLGRLRYQEQKYKDAEKHFREALKPRADLQLTQDLTEELRAYYILSVYQGGDEKRAMDIMSVSIYIFTESRIRSLPLSSKDKSILREIIREYMKR